MLSVTKIMEFEAAHCLPNHKGRCKALHGHSYKLEVEIGSDVINDDGMIVDFGQIKEIVRGIVDDNLDHTYLNDFFIVPPTAENMVLWIVDELQRRLKCDGFLTRVRLWETSNSYAEWRMQ